jgi:hypothetical protein
VLRFDWPSRVFLTEARLEDDLCDLLSEQLVPMTPKAMPRVVNEFRLAMSRSLSFPRELQPGPRLARELVLACLAQDLLDGELVLGTFLSSNQGSRSC